MCLNVLFKSFQVRWSRSEGVVGRSRSMKGLSEEGTIRLETLIELIRVSSSNLWFRVPFKETLFSFRIQHWSEVLEPRCLESQFCKTYLWLRNSQGASRSELPWCHRGCPPPSGIARGTQLAGRRGPPPAWPGLFACLSGFLFVLVGNNDFLAASGSGEERPWTAAISITAPSLFLAARPVFHKEEGPGRHQGCLYLSLWASARLLPLPCAVCPLLAPLRLDWGPRPPAHAGSSHVAGIGVSLVGRLSCGYPLFEGAPTRCSGEILANFYGEFPVKFRWHSGEFRWIMVKCWWNYDGFLAKLWKSVLKSRKATKNISHPPHSLARKANIEIIIVFTNTTNTNNNTNIHINLES